MSPRRLTSFYYYQAKPEFNGVCLRNNLPKLKDGAYINNLEEYKSIGTHWRALHVNDDGSCFDSFRLEYIPKEIKKFIGNKNIITNIYRLQAYKSITCRYFCIGFIDFILEGKRLLNCTNSFSQI